MGLAIEAGGRLHLVPQNMIHTQPPCHRTRCMARSKLRPWRRGVEDTNNQLGCEKEVAYNLVAIGTCMEDWEVGWRRIFASGRRGEGSAPPLVFFVEKVVRDRVGIGVEEGRGRDERLDPAGED